MTIRSAIAISTVSMLAAGCAVQQHQERLASCEAQGFRTQVERVTCLNNAEVGTTYPDIRARRHSMRLALAAKVDAGEMTQAQADEFFSRQILELQDEYNKRRNAMAGVQGALIGVRFR